MIRLTKTLNAWGTPGFEEILKGEVEQLDSDQLSLAGKAYQPAVM